MICSGDVYIVCEGQEQDVYVFVKYLNIVMNGDKVKIWIWMFLGCCKLEGEVE